MNDAKLGADLPTLHHGTAPPPSKPLKRIGILLATCTTTPTQRLPPKPQRIHRTTCHLHGLSILLVMPAAVGVPWLEPQAWPIGTTRANTGGNSRWPTVVSPPMMRRQSLDRGWFTGAASKAIAGDPVFGVGHQLEAVDGHHHGMDPESRAVGGEDVTTRYAHQRTPPKWILCVGSGTLISRRRTHASVSGRCPANYGCCTSAGTGRHDDMPRFKVDPGLADITVGKGKTPVPRHAGPPRRAKCWWIWCGMAASLKTKPSVSPNGWCDSVRCIGQRTST